MALKDARQTSTELALSALQSLRGSSRSLHPHDEGTAAAADAGGGSPDNGASSGATVPDQSTAILASFPLSGASLPTGAGAATSAEAGTAEGAAAANVDKGKDPTAPVPVVDDQGNPVIIPEGPYKGQQMLRPAGLRVIQF